MTLRSSSLPAPSQPCDRGFLGTSSEERVRLRPSIACDACGGVGGIPVSVCCRRGREECGGDGCHGPEQELEPCGTCETTGTLPPNPAFQPLPDVREPNFARSDDLPF